METAAQWCEIMMLQMLSIGTMIQSRCAASSPAVVDVDVSSSADAAGGAAGGGGADCESVGSNITACGLMSNMPGTDSVSFTTTASDVTEPESITMPTVTMLLSLLLRMLRPRA